MLRSLSRLLLALLVLGSLYAWMTDPSLAERFTAWEWWLLPGVALATVALLLGIAHLAPRYPGLLNIPDKKAFLQLSPARRQPVLQHIQQLMDWVVLEVTVIMGLIQFAQYQSGGTGEMNVYMIVVLVLALGVSPLVAFVFVARIQAEIKHQLRADAEQPTEG